ncbi:hypothetical protein D8M04_03320 [Oceanobacillus piezotolerans]|uniref:Uncharacterized protein n=1 Tax=Oceanobacillus piezotolerans TaxID=2448030 RepID=A0A498DB13_9BACI|nr:hypothetical protein [Oceanobacillus piezotolerans]RLL48314.1 hypothetical protein D8M04_03320 [Oceanobacillus piezotolerans]
MHGMLQSFLETEISHQDYYDGIISFIYSVNIRSGEYECNQFIVKKMDLLNFIIYEEYEINQKREIHYSFSIYKNKLIKAINDYAKKQGLLIRDFDWTRQQ